MGRVTHRFPNRKPGPSLKPRTPDLAIAIATERIEARMNLPIKVPDVAPLLRQMRVQQGISQKTLAHALGHAGKGAICQIEQGIYVPSIIKAAQVAHALGYQMRISFVAMDDET